MRVLIVDNHDSYTYNLFQLIAGTLGSEPLVVANDDPRWQDLDPAGFDAAVISPGPGTPRRAADLGQARRVLAEPDLPVLGVCLGHQAIAHHAGAVVAAAPVPRHGHLSRVRHDGSALFTGVPQDFTAVRYHSLCVVPPLPEELEATAWAEDGVVMALRHRALPRWGVQFHPESVASEHGRTLVANFARLAADHRRLAAGRPGAPGRQHAPRAAAASRTPPRRRPDTSPPPPGALRFRVLERALDAEAVFLSRYADREYAFWLDSSLVGGPARFSFLGGPDGPRGEVLTYRVGDGAVRVRRADGTAVEEPGTVFDVLAARVAATPTAHPDLPFDFVGGYVGYFGYELKAHCGGAAAHRAVTPDAVWLRCDRFVAVDHVADRTYLVAADGDEEWLEQTERALADLPSPPDPPEVHGTDPAAAAERSRAEYLADVKECLGELAAGESYEICLTNRVRLPAPADGTAFYRRLRRASPAPYAALLHLGPTAVYSASPERFLRVGRDGTAESRPIKGTAPRHGDPVRDAHNRQALLRDPKTRAENLMIVDLLRNDLGRVCAVGSVEVPGFLYTESYATVHQLVSTIRGRLRPDRSALDAVVACFPPGSMTGAPKERTMQILDRLETSARGVYSGALGYLSYSGTADLSVVIRTAVCHGGELTVGAGGAVVLDSVPAHEHDEMLLKAAVPLRALERREPAPVHGRDGLGAR
ncbi:aminodeoxychorismate synthase component I [Thermobifida cellulosilytica]|uniref:aminodeoxychorismate synthase n=1 Tax=Thermobifida cellulosilytica TB100 TaxID=665004 RepID=A0A147KKS5_THECS|nr:aminodeoxychorismate synthase component I [Thermobifida cellulosilytica]KUP97843.1 anthranilate synthase [Thermobifida cellulosilytica TB100]